MYAARQGLGLVCPKVQGGEAAWAGELDVLAPDHLIQLINHCKGRQILSAPKPQLAEEDARYPDLKDIKGQESAKRALEIAAAGAHNLFMLCNINVLSARRGLQNVEPTEWRRGEDSVVVRIGIGHLESIAIRVDANLATPVLYRAHVRRAHTAAQSRFRIRARRAQLCLEANHCDVVGKMGSRAAATSA